MKKTPVSVEGERRLDGRRLDEYAKSIAAALKQDRSDSNLWLQGRREDYERRFGLRKEVIRFPWKNASDARLGLSDVHVTEFKPAMVNVMLGSGRIYQMVAQDGQSWDHARHASMAMDSLCRWRMPDYIQQKLLTIESVAQHGVGFEKIFYDYRTEQKVETIRRRDLPPQLANFAVVEDPDPTTLLMAKSIGVVLMNRAEFDRQAPQIRELVKSLYGLDDEDPVDEVAANEIMKFLRNGSRESNLFIKRRAVVVDTPRLINVPIEQLIVPQGTACIEQAGRLAHRMFFTEGEIKQRARDEVWDKAAVERLFGSNGGAGKPIMGVDYDELSLAKRDRWESLSDTMYGQDAFEVWETYAWWDIDRDGLDERVVLTIEPTSGAVLKAIEYPYDIPSWNFVQTSLEMTDASVFAPRGIPRQIEHLEKHANALVRAEENNLLIETSRSFLYDPDSGINPLSIQWMPSLMIPARPDQIVPLEMSSKALQLEAPMRNMVSMAERMVSGANRNVLDMPPPERRTATEVQSFESARQRIRGIQGLLFQDAQTRSGNMLWALWRQYGPDEFYVSSTGKPPIKLTQAQISGKFIAFPVGAAGDMDPGYKAGQALSMLDITMKLAGAIADDPRYTVNIVPAFLEWAYQSNPLLAEQLISENPPEVVQGLVQQRQQLAAQLSQYEQEAQKAIQNTPADPKAQAELTRYIISNMPHKDFQQLIGQAQQARAGAARSAILAANGAAS